MKLVDTPDLGSGAGRYKSSSLLWGTYLSNMIVFYKNYDYDSYQIRSDRTYLSIQSVRYLFPNIDIRCLFLYNESPNEYDDKISKFKDLGVTIYFSKKTHRIGDGSGRGSEYNGLYFTEGINKIQNICKDIDDKVLILDEDSYFTTGETIRFLQNNKFDFAYAEWPSPYPVIYKEKAKVGINGSILCINPKKLNSFFPIIEQAEYVETLLGHEIYEKCLELNYKVIEIETKIYPNFKDGIWTNESSVIEKELKENNIPFKKLNE